MNTDTQFDKMMKNPKAVWTLNILSGVALLIASAWFVNNLFSARLDDTPPRIVNSIVIEPTVLLPGSPFKVRINATLNRLCPYEVHWALVRKSDGVEVVRIIDPVKQPPEKLGTQDLPVTERYIPGGTAPGSYTYASEVFDVCGEGHTSVSVRKSADITVR